MTELKESEPDNQTVIFRYALQERRSVVIPHFRAATTGVCFALALAGFLMCVSISRTQPEMTTDYIGSDQFLFNIERGFALACMTVWLAMAGVITAVVDCISRCSVGKPRRLSKQRALLTAAVFLSLSALSVFLWFKYAWFGKEDTTTLFGISFWSDPVFIGGFALFGVVGTVMLGLEGAYQSAFRPVVPAKWRWQRVQPRGWFLASIICVLLWIIVTIFLFSLNNEQSELAFWLCFCGFVVFGTLSTIALSVFGAWRIYNE